MTVKTVKPSICICGFPVLEVPLGTEYDVMDRVPKRATLICGGCGLKIPVDTISVRRTDRSQNDQAGELPVGIFDL